jgi:hypothetical protein
MHRLRAEETSLYSKMQKELLELANYSNAKGSIFDMILEINKKISK